jgi:hypothetical protein
MHVRSKAIAVVTVFLVSLGISAFAESSTSAIFTEESVIDNIPIISSESPSIESSASSSVAPTSSNIPHIGCPAGFEASYMTTPFTLNGIDNNPTNFWPTCEWTHDGREFPGCPTYDLAVVFPPICIEHLNRS